MLRLRDQIAHKNESITSTVKTLVATRADLLATPTSFPTSETRNVPYTELLDYAKTISRYTVPPTFRSALPLPVVPISTPAPAIINGAAASPVKEKEGDAENGEGGQKDGIGMGSLEEVERQWLDPQAGMGFVPWIGEEAMRSGALAAIQAMVERGEDPETEGVEQGEAMEDLQEAVDGAMAEEGQRRVERRVEREEKPRVFGGLDLYDPDEEG